MIKRNKEVLATPPGETIKEQLELRGWSPEELAKTTGAYEGDIYNLLEGDIPLSEKTAIKLEQALGLPKSFWLNLEQRYRQKLKLIEMSKNEKDDSP